MALKFKAEVDTPRWLQMIRDKQKPVATAAVAALRDVAAASVQEGRADIAAAGPGFRHAQWVPGLQYLTKGDIVGGAPSLQASAVIFHRYGIAGVFEHGATLKGSPLMWIPATKGGAPRLRGERQTGVKKKKLTFATVKGVPLAFDASDKSRDRKPLYIGVPQVVIPKKFHITEIAKANLQRIGQFFLQEFKDN